MSEQKSFEELLTDFGDIQFDRGQWREGGTKKYYLELSDKSRTAKAALLAAWSRRAQAAEQQEDEESKELYLGLHTQVDQLKSIMLAGLGITEPQFIEVDGLRVGPSMIRDMRERLQKLETGQQQQEPFGWAWLSYDQWIMTKDKALADDAASDSDFEVIPLYTHPQPQVQDSKLTPEQVERATESLLNKCVERFHQELPRPRAAVPDGWKFFKRQDTGVLIIEPGHGPFVAYPTGLVAERILHSLALALLAAAPAQRATSDDLRRYAKAVVNHWCEFGIESGFDEKIDCLDKALKAAQKIVIDAQMSGDKT